ncbi:hypothetical protein KY326_04205 [Candidatus Woesearchaeota archaeon]|nr:hypothetical protein [Candidatus Woesearchaeota archaeon]
MTDQQIVDDSGKQIVDESELMQEFHRHEFRYLNEPDDMEGDEAKWNLWKEQ